MTDSSSAKSLAPTAPFLPLLLLLFLGSGCAALIYEIVWLQMLQLVIGSTAISLGILLGTFMAGMCLGSLALPRFVSRHQHPLRVYAYLELGIGVIGILILFGLPQIEKLYTAFGHGTFGIVLRGVVAALFLLPPTFLMGATLPAVARWVETTPRGVSWLGFFYGGNIAGAVVGCLLAGFFLLRVFDMATATYVALAINVAVAGLALGLAALSEHRAPADQAEEAHAKPATGARAVYFVIALSGLCALGAEVIWTRLLSLLLGGTVYTFSIILAVFLAGLGMGSGAGSFLSRGNVSPRVLLGICQLLLTGAIAWTAYMVSGPLPHWPVDPSLSLSPWYTFQLDLSRTIWAVLPGAILWGASFPLAMAAVATKGQDPGRLVGGVYAANTVGAILGAVGMSVVLIPWLGTETSQRILILLCIVGGLVTLLPAIWRSWVASPSPLPAKTVLGFAGAAAGTGIAIWLAVILSPIPWGMVGYGRFMATYMDELVPGITAEEDIPRGYGEPDEPNQYALYVGEGMNVSVVVSEVRGSYRSFHGGGKVQASNDPADMRLQRMLGHIPALVHPDPKKVLIVACGAGVTAGSFVPYRGIERIVICDIEPLVPKYVAPMFAVENYDVVNDVRTEVFLDDGRHFIRTTEEMFDIITSDPIDPWVKGCAALNTIEYYQMCRDHLNPGGIMALWMPLYESNEETLKSVIATFFQVFPNGILWTNDLDGEGYDAILFGQKGGTEINVDALEERLARPDHSMVRSSLADVEFYSVAELLATYAGQASQMKQWTEGAQLNTDLNLRLQYLAGMSVNSFMGEELLQGILEHYQFPDNIFVGSPGRLAVVERELRAAGRGR